MENFKILEDQQKMAKSFIRSLLNDLDSFTVQSIETKRYDSLKESGYTFNLSDKKTSIMMLVSRKDDNNE